MSEQEPIGSTMEGVSQSSAHELLAHQRRRSALHCLTEHESLALPDLAEEIACHEQDTSITEIPEEDVLQVYSSLWHTHIPKLTEAAVVEYDQETDIVRLGDNAEQVNRLRRLHVPDAENET